MKKKGELFQVVLAFATVYFVWGSTYFFIQMAVKGMPAMLLGAIRFTTAGVLLLTWCQLRGERPFSNMKHILNSGIAGVLILFIGTGAVIWVEKILPSSLVGVIISTEILWITIFDRPMWGENFRSKRIVLGLALGFAGVLILLSKNFDLAGARSFGVQYLISSVILIAGTMAWGLGAVYTKYTDMGPAHVSASWQMVIAGLVFVIISIFQGDLNAQSFRNISANSWVATAYLIVFGSLAAYYAYVWLIKTRPIRQVSTHILINPLVAVLLGVVLADEKFTGFHVIGLTTVLLATVLFIGDFRKPSEPLPQQ